MILTNIREYHQLIEKLIHLNSAESFYIYRNLCRKNLFFLLYYVLGRKDMNHQFLIDRCNDVQESPDGHLDLWARGFYKSTIITFGKTIQDILSSHGDDPLPEWEGIEPTFGIFSHTRPIAKGFLRQIKRELEGNDFLKKLFPDVLWADYKEAPKWALDVETPVLTINGWKKHGDLQIGDEIFGSKGQVIKVIGVSGHMEDKECRRVVFDDCEFISSSEHLWTLEHKIKSWRKWEHGKELVTIKTDDLPVFDKNYRMLPTPIIEMPEKELSLDPYILGLWLGDGTINSNIISMHRDDESEILVQISNAGFVSYINRRHEEDNFSMYGVKGLKEKLVELKCVSDKHIPHEYLISSIDQRLSLLQGLMDSDGTCKKPAKNRCAGMCMFSNTNKKLAEDVYYLAASLGMRPSIIDFMQKCRARKRTYQVYFVGVKSNSPFRLSRKNQYLKDTRVKTARYCRAVESIEKRIVNCIKVDSDDHLYLAGLSLVPTHNSEDDGLVLKRKSNPKESTIEAWGLVEGQPTSKHFNVLIYDDVVTQGSVYTPEMMKKTLEAWEMSINLGAKNTRRRLIGTRYHFNDAYREIIKRGAANPRIYAGTHDGTLEGEPVFKTKEQLNELRKVMGRYSYSTQILQNPLADEKESFQHEWLQWHKGSDGSNMNKYIVVDPANEKKKTSDFTAIWVIGLGQDRNYYVLDIVRDRLNLVERANRLFSLHKKWRPLKVGYEQYGMQADIEHIKDRQNRENYRFTIEPLGGKIPKNDRIRRLIASFTEKRWYFPESLFKTNYEGKTDDLIDIFIHEEFLAFPVGVHDDMLDSMSRILDDELNAIWPKVLYDDNERERYRPKYNKRVGSAWSA